MANSYFIEKAKNKIAREFIKDDEIVQAIDSHFVKTREGLLDTHIFTYHQNPNTIHEVKTFITIQVHIPEGFTRNHSNNTFVNPRIEIWIISHFEHMKVKNVPKVTANRNDYLSRLIDVKLNGRSDFGIGKLTLKSNVESSYQQDYLYRTMIFECMDVNDSLCDDE